MSTITVNGEDRLVVFGGINHGGLALFRVELYNNQTGKWENTQMKLNARRYSFGFTSVKLGIVIEKL